MLVILRQRALRRPFRTAACLLCAVALTGLFCHETASWLRLRIFERGLAGVEHPASAPDQSATLDFPFRGRALQVKVRFSSAAVRRAQAFDFSPTFAMRGAWRERFVASAVVNQSQTPFMDELARALRVQRRSLGLNEDEYLELMSSAIQCIPYGRVGAPLKTPIEVVATGSGVCTEKSVLLAALLIHEGYGASLWSLYGHSHVGAGVRTTGDGFRGSGYAFIETTRPAYVGQLPGDLAGAGPVHARPQLIEIADGRAYHADGQVSYILWMRDAAQRATRRRAGSGRLNGPLADTTVDPTTAERLVRWIDWNSHDRERVFERLTAAGSGGRDALLGL